MIFLIICCNLWVIDLGVRDDIVSCYLVDLWTREADAHYCLSINLLTIGYNWIDIPIQRNWWVFWYWVNYKNTWIRFFIQCKNSLRMCPALWNLTIRCFIIPCHYLNIIDLIDLIDSLVKPFRLITNILMTNTKLLLL